MSSSLRAGFAITSVDGRHCTLVPRTLTNMANDTAPETTSAVKPSSTTKTTTTASSSTEEPDKSSSSAPSISSASNAAPTSTKAPEPAKAPAPSNNNPTAAVTQPVAAAVAAPAASSSSSSSSGANVVPADSKSAAPAASAATTTTAQAAGASGISSKTSTSTTTASGFGGQVAAAVKSGSSTSSFSINSLSSTLSLGSGTATDTSMDGTSTTPLMTGVGGMIINANGEYVPNTIATATATQSSKNKSSKPSNGSGASTDSSNGSSPSRVAPVVGGVFGCIALISLVGLLVWFCKKRRKDRDSFQTAPAATTRDETYDDDASSLNEKWHHEVGGRVQDVAVAATVAVLSAGSRIKSKFQRDRSASPPVNMNRGNSQFLDETGAQEAHDDGSIMEQNAGGTFRGKVHHLWTGVAGTVASRWPRKREQVESQYDPFARGMRENHMSQNPFDFHTLLAMDENSVATETERRRTLSSPPSIGSSLGLDFGRTSPERQRTGKASPTDPFADAKAITPPGRIGPDPFSDPQVPMDLEDSYLTDVRHSRGNSVDQSLRPGLRTRGVSIAEAPTHVPPPASSRYPSTIAGQSRNSYRDTAFSGTSYNTNITNARRGKGRSDPFDLERPELLSNKHVPPVPAHGASQRQTYRSSAAPPPLKPIIKHNRQSSSGMTTFSNRNGSSTLFSPSKQKPLSSYTAYNAQHTSTQPSSSSRSQHTRGPSTGSSSIASRDPYIDPLRMSAYRPPPSPTTAVGMMRTSQAPTARSRGLSVSFSDPDIVREPSPAPSYPRAESPPPMHDSLTATGSATSRERRIQSVGTYGSRYSGTSDVSSLSSGWDGVSVAASGTESPPANRESMQDTRRKNGQLFMRGSLGVGKAM